MGLPTKEAEAQVVRRHAEGFNPRDLAAAGLGVVATPEDIEAARAEIAAVEISDDVVGYIVDICRATREAPSVALGASPRAAAALMTTSRAWAWMRASSWSRKRPSRPICSRS